jgi:hypothetical protein
MPVLEKHALPNDAQSPTVEGPPSAYEFITWNPSDSSFEYRGNRGSSFLVADETLGGIRLEAELIKSN